MTPETIATAIAVLEEEIAAQEAIIRELRWVIACLRTRALLKPNAEQQQSEAQA